MKDAKKQNWNVSRYLFAKLRKSYDLTDFYAELLQDEPDYNRLTAELAGVSMVAVERGDIYVDDNGDDLGDDVA
ncbi:MAG: hypothetical protein IJH67_08135 [Thermoguttaceae bacterium]|nr:hypothetical protein [Thermoguttaceae bacterium]